MREFHKSIEKICDAVQTAGLTKEKYAIYVSSTSINISVSFGFRVFSVFPHILSLYCYLLLLFVLFAFTALSIFDVVCPLNCAFLSRKRMLQETQDDYQKNPLKLFWIWTEQKTRKQNCQKWASTCGALCDETKICKLKVSIL